MSTEPNNRPLMQLRIDALKLKCERHADNPAELLALFDELAYRHSKKARELRTLALTRLRQMHPPGEFFKWPSTRVQRSASGQIGVVNWRAEGVLRILGYRVGVSGVSAPARHDILDLAFKGRLPAMQDQQYGQELGAPDSSTRLQKLANIIAGLARNAKRKELRALDRAIRDWERDLEYLRISHYEGRFSFRWPEI